MGRRVKTRGFKKMQKKLDLLNRNMKNDIEEYVESQTKNLKEEIKEEIKRQGLVETGDLLYSFKIKRTGGGPNSDQSWEVYSTEAHADYLEHGTDGPDIIRPDKADVLAWIPENPSEYDTDSDGYVYRSVVYDHPGNDAYNFVAKAQDRWRFQIAGGLRAAVTRAIVDSGLRPGGAI